MQLNTTCFHWYADVKLNSPGKLIKFNVSRSGFSFSIRLNKNAARCSVVLSCDLCSTTAKRDVLGGNPCNCKHFGIFSKVIDPEKTKRLHLWRFFSDDGVTSPAIVLTQKLISNLHYPVCWKPHFRIHQQTNSRVGKQNIVTD